MDFGYAFTYVTEDEAWLKKLALGGLFTLLGIFLLPAFIILGYQIAVVRNVMSGKKRPLPEWSDFGQLFLDGVLLFVGLLAYVLPIIILIVVAQLLPIGGSLIGVATGNEDFGGAGGVVGIVLFFALICIGIMLGFFFSLIQPAILLQYAREGTIGSIFQLGKIFRLFWANLVDFLLVFVANLVAQFILQIISAVLIITICGPFIAVIVGGFWVQLVTGHLVGQIGAKLGDSANAVPAF